MYFKPFLSRLSSVLNFVFNVDGGTGTGLGWKLIQTPNSSLNLCKMYRATHSSSPAPMQEHGPIWNATSALIPLIFRPACKQYS